MRTEDGAAARKLFDQAGTPTRLGMTIGKEYMGKEYTPHPWTLYAEKRILPAFSRPGKSFFALNVPPQVGKSTFMMLLCCWFLGMNPFEQVIGVGYADEFMAGWGAKVRDMMKRYGPRFFGESVSSQSDARSNWKLSNGFGGMLTAGIGGQITGNPGNLIWIDDVLKNMQEAASLTSKEMHWSEYQGAISSRFHENTVVIVTATRFVEDDITGRIEQRQNDPAYEGDRYEILNFPAMAMAPEELEGDELEEWRDILGRANDEHLESTHSRKHYIDQRETLMSNFIWDAVWQQSPGSRKGGMFPKDKWQFWRQADLSRPRVVRAVRAWDLATTAGGGDWTVGTKMGLLDTGDIALLDRVRVQFSSSDVEKLVKETARKDGFQVKIIIEQEKAGAGHTVVENYKRVLRGFTVEPGKITGSKEERATPYSIEQQNGHIWLPGDDKQLCDEWIDEHSKMMGDGRRGQSDDQIDTGAYCVLDLLGNEGSTMFVPGMDELLDDQGEIIPLPTTDNLMALLTGSNAFFSN